MIATVTGATGFLGRHIVCQLLEEKYEVVVIVRDKSHIPVGWKNKVTVIEMDIKTGKFQQLLQYKTDIFFHLAWEETAGSGRGNPELQLDNVKASCAILNVAKKMECKKFVFAGSIMEYEAMEYLVQDNAAPSVNMIYSTSKLTADFMLKIIAKDIGIDYVNVLISNVYGPGEDEKSPRFLNMMLRKMLNDEKLELTLCEQLYDFIYVKDAVKAIVMVGSSKESFGTYYIGNKQVRKLKCFVQEMQEITNTKSEIAFGIVPYNNSSHIYDKINTERIFSELGFFTEFSFSDGLKKMIEWIKGR